MTETNNTTTELTKAQTEFANALYEAYRTNTPLNVADYDGVVGDDDTAYRVQKLVMEKKGEPVGGYKVSLTSEQTQKMFDSDSPLYGAQLADHFLASPTTYQLEKLNEPLVEVELVFTAKEDLSPDDSLEDLFNKTTVAGALEVPDARFADWFPSLPKHMVMADCAVGGLVVYGKEMATNEVFASVEQVAEVTATLSHDGEKLDKGTSAEVLGNPLNSLQWLVKKLASQGVTFKKGQRVSSGTFVLPPKFTKGKWQVAFDHGLGEVVVEAK